ncbi:T9SS type A sorting domain-containing protein, partial [candidate division WOR-3 bacterium]|nr:T9SS type A sorting domain-containing protein [candidate division WOR-3 bacterium]
SRNSFQIVLTKADSSITIQYRVQTGVPPGSPSGWNPYNDVIGLENITGLVGLRYLYGGEPSGNIPHAGLALRFRPPASTGYSIRDMMVKEVLSRNSNGIHVNYPVVQPLSVWARFKNSGTQAVSSDSVYAEIRNWSGTVVWSGGGRLGALASGAETTFVFGNWSAPALGTYALKVRSILPGDGYAGNDSQLVEIRAVNYSLTSSVVGWDSATVGDFGPLGDYHAFAVKITPPTYPVMVDQIQVCFASASGNTIHYAVWDDDGANGAPGTVLYSTQQTVPGPGWRSVSFSGVVIPSGSFYVGYRTGTRSGPSIATDTVKLLSRNNWERQVHDASWYWWRWNQEREFRIRCRVGPAPGTRNVGVTAVVRPAGGTLDSGVSVVPLARVRNFGQQTETFNVTLRINSNPVYQQTRSKTLAAGIEDTVTFPAWTARPGYGLFARCSVYLAQDQNRADDTLSGARFDVYYRDVTPASIDRPRDTADAGTQIVPRVAVRNLGNTAENVPVQLRITGTSYDQTVSKYLGVGATDTVVFPAWTVVTGATGVRCSTMLAGDMNRANDLVTAPLYVREYDVSAVAINVPTGNVDSGTAVRPVAQVRNNGTQAATFNVRLRIEGETYSQVRSKTLGAGLTDTVGFPNWTPRTRGSHTVVCSTAYSLDRTPANDRVTGSVFVVVRDAGVSEIISPDDTIGQGPVSPAVAVRNFGNTVADVRVRFRIENSTYDETAAVRLTSGQLDTVLFPVWQPEAGRYTVRCSTMLAGDMNRANDPASAPVLVVQEDVEVEAVLVPVGRVDSGATLVPLARVRNNNVVPASFNVRLRIEGETYNRVRGKTLGPGVSDTVAFPAWTAQVRGPHLVRCSTEYVPDRNPANDFVTELVDVVVHDVGTAAILAPVGRMSTKGSSVPRARVRNYGSVTESFDVRFEIGDGYTRTATVANLGPGEETAVAFDAWSASGMGSFRVRCSTMLATDVCPANDRHIDSVQVGSDWPSGWHEVASLPVGPSGRAVRHGGWIACDAGSQLVYAAKGNKTGDFYAYAPYSDTWVRLASIPQSAEGRLPAKGAVGCAGGDGRVYALTGANTVAFWCYIAGDDSWVRLADVLLEPSYRKVRGGTDVEHVVVNDTGYVYLLKGGRDDFLRFNTVAGTWQVLPEPQSPGGRRWHRGSWLVSDGTGRIFAHKARCHEFMEFNVSENAWRATLLAGMPRQSTVTGRRKKSRDGSDGAWLSGGINALKGGNTQEFWRYDPAGDSWSEQDTMPAFGTTGRRKRVWYGGDIAGYGGMALFALKGNKTLECWRYVPGDRCASGCGPRVREGVLSSTAGSRSGIAAILPNPLPAGGARARLSSQTEGWSADPVAVTVIDASGRQVRRTEVWGRQSEFVLHLPAGVYLVRLSSSNWTTTTTLVVHK